MMFYNLTIRATDNNERSGITADASMSLTVETAYIQTDEHGAPTATAITALRCLAHLETIVSHATGNFVVSPDAEIAELKAHIAQLERRLSTFTDSSL